ncbi:MAG: hypothetical protein KGK08_04695 [Acidobacteriota bacterium]|nr:hypothetical protein [Acidobacteriota bacterium]
MVAALLAAVSTGMAQTAEGSSAAQMPTTISVQKDAYDKTQFWINVVLSMMGVLSATVAVFTLKTVKGQTGSLEKQVRHLISSERAWLVIASSADEEQVLRTGAMHEYRWTVKNIGKTPARILETMAVCRVAEMWSPLPDEPTYYRDAIAMQERILPPGASMEFHTHWTSETGEMFTRPLELVDAVFLFAYGYVKYKTVLGEDVYESRFCDEFFHVAGEQLQEAGEAKIVFQPFLEASQVYTYHS